MESYDLHSESDSEFIGRRKGRKIMAEKRRRARINQCLTEIKDIVFSSRKHNDPNFDKMEKAEILETTVDYLRNVRKNNTVRQQIKETIQSRFQEGFSRCAEEILTYIRSQTGVSDKIQCGLRKHLNGRLSRFRNVPVTSSTPDMTTHISQWEHRLHPSSSQYLCLSAYDGMNLAMSSVRNEKSLEDSGYVGSPDSVKYSKDVLKSDAVSASELCMEGLTSQNFKDIRVSAWVESTLSYSQQTKMEQQAPWRPW